MAWHSPVNEFVKLHFAAAIDIHMAHGVVKLAVSKVATGPLREVAQLSLV